MFQIIDRRLAGKNKSVGNRERFIERHKTQIREAVKRIVSGRSIRDMEQAAEVRIPKRDLSEPVFSHGDGGIRDVVHPGNQEYSAGDRIAKPRGGQGKGNGNEASDSDETSQDDFVFSLNRDEFMKLFFEDLELPDMMQSEIADIEQWKSQRSGFSSEGNPSNLSVVRSMRGSLGRRIALTGDVRAQLRELREELQSLDEADAHTPARREQLNLRIAELEVRKGRVAFLDPIDLKYRNRTRVPCPISRAVMFCLMDVSGSMDEPRKDLAKRFFVLLYLFLTRHYERIDLVFIRHHTQATEVTEQEFFDSTETGGTVVSSALKLMSEIAKERYGAGGWNLYVAQAGDGDNYTSDTYQCQKILMDDILPQVRYFAYLQVAEDEQSLWEAYQEIAEERRNFASQKALGPADIYPIFRELFKKRGTSAARA